MKHLLLTTIAAVVLVGCGPSVPDISIHDAAFKGNIEAVKQHLAAGVDVNAKDNAGGAPLIHAAWNDHKDTAELLIAKGADVNAKNKKYGQAPLHIAAAHGYKEIAELLIAEGADVNANNNDSKTPLDLVATWDLFGSTRSLLRKHGGKTGEELKAEGK